MTLNTVEEIKKRLLLESEDQTIDDETIEEYIEEANEEMFDTIKREFERDVFYADEGRYYLWFPAVSIEKVYIDGEETTDYALEGSQKVLIEGYDSQEKIEIEYIPKIYKLYERAICICNLMTRLNPMVQEQPSTIYLNWSNKKKKYESQLNNKFGINSYEN